MAGSEEREGDKGVTEARDFGTHPYTRSGAEVSWLLPAVLYASQLKSNSRTLSTPAARQGFFCVYPRATLVGRGGRAPGGPPLGACGGGAAGGVAWWDGMRSALGGQRDTMGQRSVGT